MERLIFAILKLVLIAFFGFFLYHKNLIKEGHLKFLTFFVVNFSVPFLIFSQIVEKFSPGLKPSFWIFIFLSAAVFTGGIIFSLFGLKFIKPELRKEFMSLVSFQNGGYLPMNIAFFLFSGTVQDQFLLYIFFYILGFNILMWSVGSFLIFREKDEKFKLQSLFSPPVVSVIAALLVVYLKIAKFIPVQILVPVKLIGKTSFVLSMIVLGAWLAKGTLYPAPRKAFPSLECDGYAGPRTRCGVYSRLRTLLGVSFLKLMVMPLAAFLIILKFKIYSLFGLFIIVEAAMPSAASLPIVASWHRRQAEFTPPLVNSVSAHRGGIEPCSKEAEVEVWSLERGAGFISQGVLFTHLVSIFTVPVWIELFLKISGYSF